MEFLVRVDIGWPADGDQDEFARLLSAERERARVLASEGIIRRMWRVPGQQANWGLWEAPDATALHEALTSLPLFPWLSIEVEPLAAHPTDPERPGGR